jgi:hypothetical protein
MNYAGTNQGADREMGVPAQRISVLEPVVFGIVAPALELKYFIKKDHLFSK